MRDKPAWTTEDRDRLVKDLRDLLPGPSRRPQPTGWYAERLGMNGFEHSTVLWPVLTRLARRGLVERIAEPGQLSRFWRLSTAGAEASDEQWTIRPRRGRR
jgi:hypothetical protein